MQYEVSVVQKTPCLPEPINKQEENITVQISQPVNYNSKLKTLLETGNAEVTEDKTSFRKRLYIGIAAAKNKTLTGSTGA